MFTNSLKIDKTKITIIEEATRNQSSSNIWYQQREGRITASKFHRVFTRMETIKSNSDATADNLIKEMLQTKKFETFATRHGIATEPHAQTSVVKVLKEQGHKKVNSSHSGTIIDENIPYISASPDLMVECTCCGKGLVEIKCPYVIRDCKPTLENLPQLEKINDKVQLKRTNAHY